MNVRALHDKYGQSAWLDLHPRRLLQSGEFERLVREDGSSRVTSNPSIFEKAIVGSTDYDAALASYEKRGDETASAIYEHLPSGHPAGGRLLLPVYDESIDATATSA